VADDVTEAVRVTAVPRMDGLFDEATELELAALLTVSNKICEVLPVKFASPP
jgi:hypothetical protein